MKKALSVTGLLYFISLLLTTLLYAIDSDSAYDSIWQTSIEFVIVSVVLMMFVTSIVGVGAVIYLFVIKPIAKKAKI